MTTQVATRKPDDREDKLIANLAIYPTWKEAALKAGYSPTYVTGSLYKTIHGKRFQARLREHYKGTMASFLPTIAGIESKVIQACNEDIEKIPKFRHTLKEIKQAAGVLSPDTGPQQPVINVSGVKNLMLQLHQNDTSTTDNGGTNNKAIDVG